MDVFGLNFNAEATMDNGSCEYATHQVEAGSMYFAPSGPGRSSLVEETWSIVTVWPQYVDLF